MPEVNKTPVREQWSDERVDAYIKGENLKSVRVQLDAALEESAKLRVDVKFWMLIAAAGLVSSLLPGLWGSVPAILLTGWALIVLVRK